MKSFSNEQAFVYYRVRVKNNIAASTAATLASASDPDIAAFLTITTWFGRCAARGGAIAGSGGLGALSLAPRTG
jgi:hypothetical protein